MLEINKNYVLDKDQKPIAVYEDIIGLLRQDASESSSIDDLFDRMVELASHLE